VKWPKFVRSSLRLRLRVAVLNLRLKPARQEGELGRSVSGQVHLRAVSERLGSSGKIDLLIYSANLVRSGEELNDAIAINPPADHEEERDC